MLLEKLKKIITLTLFDIEFGVKGFSSVLTQAPYFFIGNDVDVFSTESNTLEFWVA